MQIIVANVVESLTKRSLQRPKDFGTSLISDYKQVHIGQSAYFMGARLFHLRNRVLVILCCSGIFFLISRYLNLFT